MKIELPKKVLFIINNLQLAGYDAFAVGGCVRDSILARKPQDWDITTSAKPAQVKGISQRRQNQKQSRKYFAGRLIQE